MRTSRAGHAVPFFLACAFFSSIGSDRAVRDPSAAAPDLPAFVRGELAALAGGSTPAAWLAAHPADSFAVFARALIRQNDDGWCARASLHATLGDGTPVVRYAYFYPPAAPASLTLPDVAPPGRLIREACRLGLIWVETAPGDSASAARVREALTQAYGPVRPDPAPWVARALADPARAAAIARSPGAEAMRLGVMYFGSARWSVVGRWQPDSTVLVSAFDRGFGGGTRVLAFAAAPLARFGSFAAEEERARLAERRTAETARAAVRLTDLPPERGRSLLDLLAAAEQAYGGEAGDSAAAGRVAAQAGTVLGDWLAGARALGPRRRAAALLAADQVVASDAVKFVLARPEGEAARRSLIALGAVFVHNELAGAEAYTHTWLAAARRLDAGGPAGRLATLAVLRMGFNDDGMCGGGGDAFRAVSDTGERFLPALTDTAMLAEVHLLVGDAYADVVGLAAGQGLEYADSSAYRAEEPQARRRAIDHYRRGIALGPRLPEARAAWLEAWRLLAGLPPTTTHFFCVYD